MKILILGAGKMGRWLSDTLCCDYEVAVFDLNVENLKYLFNVQRFTQMNEIKIFNPNLVINAVSLQHTQRAFESIINYISKDCILSDISSVKNSIESFYIENNRKFVSSHPMFGPTFSDAKNLKGQSAIIINESCEEGKVFFENIYSKLGIKIYYLNFKEHDKTIAYSLTTPFAATMMFTSCIKKQKAPGTTFQKHIEIAKGLLSEDEFLISEIMFNKYSEKQLLKISEKLKDLTDIIKSKDQNRMKNYINNLRDNI